MAQVEIAPEVAEDFARILEHLETHEAQNISSRIEDIIAALNVLERNPLIGPARGDKRELVIGRGARGYLALYRYIPEADLVLVLAIRNQREAGYSSK